MIPFFSDQTPVLRLKTQGICHLLFPNQIPRLPSNPRLIKSAYQLSLICFTGITYTCGRPFLATSEV